METKTDKKNNIRQGIIDSAKIYSDLVGKNFLYIYGEEYFEVSFPVDHFLHFTGVETTLSAKSTEGEIVDFIFSKDASFSQYTNLLFADKNKNIPERIKGFQKMEEYI